MKKQLRLLSIAFAGVVTMIACERRDLYHDLRPDFSERRNANNGMIKSYDNSVVLKWNEAVSLAVDNKMPPPPEARIYAMVMLAMHDALNNAVPKFKTYALDNRGVYFKDVSKKNIQSIADAARATPPTPTYPSTHAEAAGAVAEILKLYFRRDNIPFTISSYALPEVERSFSSFSQFATEVSLSRIYIGYHFRNDIVQGEKMGRNLAKFVFENNLREL